MTDYSQLSDFEINKRVSDFFWPDINKSPECNNKTFPQNSSVVYMDNGYGGFSRDYCNNPADAWPIISSSRISVEYDSEDQCDVPCEWVTAYGIDGLKVHVVSHQPCDKALRAAMIVFLMMQEKSK